MEARCKEMADEIPADCGMVAGLLAEQALIVDVRSHRIVQAVTFRPAKRGRVRAARGRGRRPGDRWSGSRGHGPTGRAWLSLPSRCSLSRVADVEGAAHVAAFSSSDEVTLCRLRSLRWIARCTLSRSRRELQRLACRVLRASCGSRWPIALGGNRAQDRPRIDVLSAMVAQVSLHTAGDAVAPDAMRVGHRSTHAVEGKSVSPRVVTAAAWTPSIICKGGPHPRCGI
jgi:hypothetical protein